MYGPSLYDSAEPEDPSGSATRPEPGTSLTASVETIDNDRAGSLTFSAGIVR